ncbi:E3 ubiquitin protein ligase UPL1-like protein, partial [Tanacetum coccineum]
VHGQLGIAKGLIGMAVEPVERVNTHNFFGVGRPLGSDRRRQQNGTSIETSGAEGNCFHHPLLSRPLQSGDLGSTHLSRGTSYRNLESLSGWNVVVAPSNMFDALVLPHNHVVESVITAAWPPALADHLQNLYSLLCHEGELLKKLASIVPSHRKFFIVELSDLARSLSSKVAESSDPPLPLGTQRLLPFIEAFMVLCDKLQENRSLLQQDNACATESKIKQSITSSSQSQTTQGTVIFPKFTEKHSRLLNAFVRQDLGLLEKSLSILLKARLLRVTVRQAYVIEDSYNQFRMRSIQDMKGRLKVHFRGEEGKLLVV